MKMKLLFTAAALLVAVAIVNGQDYKKFRVGVGLGYAIPGGAGAGGGILVSYFEPGYRINDKILVNLRMEAAAIIRGTVDDVGADLSVAGSNSYTLNGQYYFSNGGFRPYVGAGVGLFSLASVGASASSSGGSVSAAAESKIGFYPRIGFDAGHFTLNLDYNIIGNTKAVGSTTEFKNSYIGIRIGGFFGGGKKK